MQYYYFVTILGAEKANALTSDPLSHRFLQVYAAGFLVAIEIRFQCKDICLSLISPSNKPMNKNVRTNKIPLALDAG